ncbi:MAG: hypothetical protein LBJ67_12240 [Planctomycetaceae bacterium]|jgi:hypothetical protein|nr:hypothetical protein [Planctomycetaceae bacterium]
MSGPKAGVAIVGGAAAVGGTAVVAAAAVALPVLAVGLIAAAVAESRRNKREQDAIRGAEEFLRSYQKERNDMLAEIERSEHPVQSLISNGESRWNTAKDTLDEIRREVQAEFVKLQANIETPQTKKEVEESLRQAEMLLAETEDQQEKFVQFHNEANGHFQLARTNRYASKRIVRQYITDGVCAGDQAIVAVNQAVEKARLAKIQLDETLLIIRQKGAEERKQELLRQNAFSNIEAAKSEIMPDSVSFIGDWMGDEAVAMMNEYLQKAEAAFQAKQYEQASLSAQETVAMYRKFYETSLQIKKNFENREIIADALIAALNDLQYDEPDVNYEPKEEDANAMLGNLTIFAKSKGETGDIRLAIDLDGKIEIDSDVPEGKENECHRLLTDLQGKIGEVVDFQITDWGRAKNYQPEAGGGMSKLKSQQPQKIKQRQG